MRAEFGIINTKMKLINVCKYLPRFTKEVFIIADRLNTKPVTYRVMDQKQEIIKGGFYHNELVRVKIKD